MTNEARAFAPAAIYDYLVEARAKLLGWVRPLTLEQYTQEFPFGKKTIRETLVEIPLAEWSYGTRLIGETPPAEHPFRQYYQTNFGALEPAWAELTDRTRRILREERDWNRVVEWKPPQRSATGATITDRPVVMRATAGGLATQMILHEVHHRAQVMAMLRQFGIAAQNLDYSILRFERIEVPA